MEKSVFQQGGGWKDVLDPSGILTEVNSLMSSLPVNMVWCLASQTLFRQEICKFHAENTPPSMSETHIVSYLEEQLGVALQ